jgi:hypothetical protein
MAITRSMNIPISVKKEKYEKELRAKLSVLKLPVVWKQVLSSQHGVTYWWNPETRKSQWNAPHGYPLVERSPADVMATKLRRRKDMIILYKFLNTTGFRVFGFSGREGDVIKAMLKGAESMSGELNKEIADGAVSKRILTLDKKLITLFETCKQTIIKHRTGVLMALNAHFPQDIVREIAENYV